MLFYNFETKIEKWIKIINSENNIPKNIVAINFGIFEGDNGYMLYIIGSKEYDPNNDDWATNEDYIPENKYFEVKNKKINNFDWEKFLNFTTETLKKVLVKNEIKNTFLGNIKHITTGFDDGDLVVIN